MDFRSLGQSGIRVPEISLGCMSLPLRDHKASQNIIAASLDYGITLFDTADLYDYGENEALLGKLISDKRHRLLIASKVGNKWNEDKSGWTWEPRKDYILKAVEDSLSRLRTDHIDIYQLHGGTIEDPYEEVIDAFELLITQGKIRAYGISSIRPNTIKRFVGSSNIQSVMLQYSLLDRRPEEFVLDFLKDNKIGILARGVISKGLQLGKKVGSFLNHSETDIKNFQSAFLELGKPLARSIKYVLDQDAISSVVVGASSEEQVHELIEAYNSMNNLDTKDLGEIISPNYYTDHR
jgi:aryl-alcohol dehydrogenase-like predicted oxidoreductase